MLYVCSRYLEQSNWRFPSLIWLQLEMWALSRKTEVVELSLLGFQLKPLYYREAKVQNVKSFGFISLAALDLARETHELKLGMTRVPGKYLCIVS